jgi:hypothetical protein
MEARIYRAVALTAVLLVSMGASHRTPNFVIQTPNPQLAQQFAQAAEHYRRELAIAWLGEPMPEWSEPCVVTVEVGPNLGAGGATTFVFSGGEVYGWRMTIQGSAQRVLDSVLPHEITHMIFACRFRRPLPRWADEGGATSVEHPSERAKHHKMLVQFLQSNRGIAFNRMFAMAEYPPDVMPLYAQGYTLSEFLIQQGGRAEFLDFLSDGMENDQWSAATARHYGYQNVGALQNAWFAWVQNGFPPIESPGSRPAHAPGAELLAANQPQARPVPLPGPQPRRPAANVVAASHTNQPGAVRSTPQVMPASGWRALGGTNRRATPAVAVSKAPDQPIRTQVTHPQPIGRPHQVILEWDRRIPAPGPQPPVGATSPVIRR